MCFAAVVQSLSHVGPNETPWTAAGQASLSFTISWSLLRFMSFESVMLSSHLILYALVDYILQKIKLYGMRWSVKFYILSKGYIDSGCSAL